MRYILPFILLTFYACSSPSAPDSSPEVEQLETDVREEPTLQEQFPDSGLLKSVDPEEIMTDDWSDDGDLELETEEKE
jgi:hypothetical protein